jgi:pimeloyl-ACP methyl ester carboxylesterase
MDDDAKVRPFRVQVSQARPGRPAPAAGPDPLAGRAARLVVELLELIGPLADPPGHGGEAADAFHLVAPSLPGFGFSGPTREPGWGVPRIAGAFAVLLDRLGYRRYGVHGGDWGAFIARELGRAHPDRVAGVHLTMLPSAVPVAEPPPEELASLTEADPVRSPSGRAQRPDRPLVGAGPRRPLPGHGGPRPAGRRHPGLLPPAPLSARSPARLPARRGGA